MRFAPGPGALVAAAFIGPGTVTACTLAGANFGFALIWALVFATLSTILLQDMAARLGAGAKLGLGEALMRSAGTGPLKWLAAGLVLAALAVGNSAYEAGNLTGGVLGMEALLGEGAMDRRIILTVLAGLAAVLLWFGGYKHLERVLVGLVVVMGLAFVTAAILVRPDLGALAGGLVPRIPENGLTTTIALIGTTIVPYNLFLHAAATRRKWGEGDGAIHEARGESLVSIGFGGLVSIMILSTAASSLFQSDQAVTNATDMARAIEPTFGALARYLVGIGLFAAGLTSAITAPMATGFVLGELIGGDASRRALWFKGTALAVVAIGLAIGLIGIRPVQLILIAQYANGLLLPVIAVFLLVVMNRKSLLGAHANGPLANLVGGFVVLVALGLGLRAIARAAGLMP
ncbi:MAG: Nramp family divalent metal transporter [Hyphomonadaceae bacterium]|nr:Nramp family divalent metal transporter [Hyphomonadaceae bacterium]